jgi:hypothetical protein
MTECKCDRCGATGARAIVCGSDDGTFHSSYPLNAGIGGNTCTAQHCTATIFKGDLCPDCIEKLTTFLTKAKDMKP